MNEAAAIGAAEFDGLLQRLGPFEPAPQLGVAVSGGADSLALTLLLDEWARARGGAVHAFTVDHALRPDSATEAAQVATWLGARGISHRLLHWTGDKPTTGLMEAARDARRDLLTRACRDRDLLHLALAHHRDDQAETILLRLAKGSGVDGLGGMAPLVETPHLRLLRPLLDQPKERLRATCARFGQAVIEDPSNLDPRFARPRLRAVAELLGGEGLDAVSLCATAARARAASAALAVATSQLLARRAVSRPLEQGGGLYMNRRDWQDEPVELRLRALAAALARTGGKSPSPKRARLAALDRALADPAFSGATLGGAQLRPAGSDGVIFLAEPDRAAEPRPLTAVAGVVVSGFRDII
ncbi:MAG: tRNA(Ile)-lysidine synthetase [Rhodospirillales bacterium]|nr:tRNA(Ile)-lysidine synthetase [Rhodospirillales bacterium]